MSTESRLRNVLTIAGSDPSGGAGLQGDLKTFSALGVYGTNVITAVIAQNTCGVASVYPVSPQAIREQLEHLLSDVTIDAVKIGMVASRDVAEVIADVLRQQRPRWIVLDPVMVAKSGDILVDDAGIRAVKEILVPLADVITPNLPEAAVLLDSPSPASLDEMEALLPKLVGLGAPYVVLKGGHLRVIPARICWRPLTVISGCPPHALLLRTFMARLRALISHYGLPSQVAGRC